MSAVPPGLGFGSHNLPNPWPPKSSEQQSLEAQARIAVALERIATALEQMGRNE